MVFVVKLLGGFQNLEGDAQVRQSSIRHIPLHSSFDKARGGRPIVLVQHQVDGAKAADALLWSSGRRVG